MKTYLLLPAKAAILLSCIGIANAEPAAIVEDVAPSVNGVQPMDVVEVGQKFTLPKGAHLTLGYFRSCLREEITGGNVTIGSDKSSVVDGKRFEEVVDCGGAPTIKTSKRGAEAAGAVFRDLRTDISKLPKSDWTLYGTSPVLRFSEPRTEALIKRLDQPNDQAIELKVNGSSVDTAKKGISLKPGGLYALSSGGKTYILKISPLAVPDAPLLSRLVPM